MDRCRLQTLHMEYWPQGGLSPLGLLLGMLGTHSNWRTQQENPIAFLCISVLVGGFERGPNDVMVGPSTHVEPDWEMGFAVFPPPS